ncbi:carboxypeptidase regulatory-like domain-containing protein [candidate division WOR-3 bacterium]|uniref:Carboxypeptidase regulatory-like domain-containing protein n=1 Tax=candidate division WOR-3 bacterium TaxID=2052148 RepID=A0A937XJI0_UNCW3|nr:carboxypeptidase regulatory-like domain-containing protein [candidate division WOR-3 bacterium]
MRNPILLVLMMGCSLMPIAAECVSPSLDSMGVVAGTVVDALSGIPLRGDVIVENTVFGSGIDSAGRFSILLASGRYQLGAYAMFHAETSESATVSAACTTRVDFRLLPREYVNDSIMATLAGFQIRDLARHPKDPAVNNSIRLAAWKTYVSGKGACGIKMTGFGVEGQPFDDYLLIENGSARIVSDSREATGIVRERRYPYIHLVDRCWDADSSRFVAIPISGIAPSDRELRFTLSDQADDKDPALF